MTKLEQAIAAAKAALRSPARVHVNSTDRRGWMAAVTIRKADLKELVKAAQAAKEEKTR
jgi:hypothetical protein